MLSPLFNPPSGLVAAGETVTIEDATPGAAIYYTVDGSTPTTSSTLYSTALTVDQTTTVMAMAVAPGQMNSSATAANYMVAARADTPVISPAGGTYTFGQSITIMDSSSEATIYYTTDGSTPTADSAVYTTPVFITESATVKAMAIAPNYASSNVANATYMLTPVTSQANEWTWMDGSMTPNCAGRPLCGAPGIYGTLDLTSPTNIPGGRIESASWTDANGHVWIFGGGGIDSYGINGSLNDLWEFDPAADLWTWRGGSGAVPCYTSPCYSAGYAGVYGTLGKIAPGNFPGARWYSATWADKKGTLWLFGGYGYDSVGAVGFLNDLWEFDPARNEWTWVSGSNTGAYIGEDGYGQFGVYGTLGTPAPGNVPGARYGGSAWTDSSGNLWLLGGQGWDAYQEQGTLNDLWEFNPSTNLWTWMGGGKQLQACDSTIGNCGLPGVYGAQGVPAAGNAPGSRVSAAAWSDRNGNLWLFGGNGYDSTGNTGSLNDLWKFNPTTNQWTWVGGSNLAPCNNYSASSGIFGGYFCGNLGTYGTLGVPSVGNIPSGTSGASTWVDSSGNFWLFGGVGLDPSGQFIGRTNVLWEFNPSTGQWVWMGGSTETANCIELTNGGGAVVCGGPAGVYGTEETVSSGNIPGSRLNALSWVDRGGNFWLFSGQETNTDASLVDQNDVWEFQPSAGVLPPAVTPTFHVPGQTSPEPGEFELDPSSGTFAIGTPVTLFNGMANASFYYTTDGSTPTTASTLYTGPISLSVSETVRAIAVASGYPNSGVATATFVVEPQTATPTFSPAPGTYTSAQTVTITDATPGATIQYTTDGVTTLQYQGPITISSTDTLQALASAAGYIDSAVAQATYTINLPPQTAAPPTFSVPAGTYTSAQTVTVADSTAGSIIYYTTNGTTPTTSSAVYSGAITVSSTETIEAIATASGDSSSAVASAAYVITAPPSFSVSGTAITVVAGAATGNASTITLTPSGGFTGAISLSCAITPLAANDPATCSVPSSVTMTGAAAQTTALTVSTTAASSALNQTRRLFWPSAGSAVLAGLVFIGIPSSRRRWQRNLGVFVLLFFITCGVFGCGGGGNSGGGGGNPGTTPGSYTITVTGTSGAIVETGTVTLTVQ